MNATEPPIERPAKRPPLRLSANKQKGYGRASLMTTWPTIEDLALFWPAGWWWLRRRHDDNNDDDNDDDDERWEAGTATTVTTTAKTRRLAKHTMMTTSTTAAAPLLSRFFVDLVIYSSSRISKNCSSRNSSTPNDHFRETRLTRITQRRESKCQRLIKSSFDSFGTDPIRSLIKCCRCRPYVI